MMIAWQTPDFVPSTPGQRTMRAITEQVAERYGIGVKDLLGPDRRRCIAHPRQEAMAEIYKTGRFSTPQIGRFFGGRDHTTVMHALRAVRARQETA